MIGAESLAAEVKFLTFVLGSLFAIFLVVIFKITKDRNLITKQKWMLIIATPTTILLGLLIGNLTGERDIILLVLLFLIITNLSYISKSITNFIITEFIYDGENSAIKNGLFVILSLLISTIELAGIFVILIFFIKK